MQAVFYFFSLPLSTDDHSRVVLSHLDGHPCSDYINASYIDVSLCCKSAWNADCLAVIINTVFCFFFLRRVLRRRTNSLQLKVNGHLCFEGRVWRIQEDILAVVFSIVYNHLKPIICVCHHLRMSRFLFHKVGLACDQWLFSLLIHLLIISSTKTHKSVFPKTPRWCRQIFCLVHNLKIFSLLPQRRKEIRRFIFKKLDSDNCSNFGSFSWLYLDRTERESGWNVVKGPWAKWKNCGLDTVSVRALRNELLGRILTFF